VATEGLARIKRAKDVKMLESRSRRRKEFGGQCTRDTQGSSLESKLAT